MKYAVIVGLILAAFGGGFYFGLEYHKNALRSDPQEIRELLKDEEFQDMMLDEMKKNAAGIGDRLKRGWDAFIKDDK